uniref:Pecanex-like protein n=1 Tax=Globodera pallida TaxID=36090 RepID=A0A183CMN4_GLOPA
HRHVEEKWSKQDQLTGKKKCLAILHIRRGINSVSINRIPQQMAISRKEEMFGDPAGPTWIDQLSHPYDFPSVICHHFLPMATKDVCDLRHSTT